MLKPRKRITKKHLKEDKLVTFYVKASAWLEKNTKYIIAGVLIVLLTIAAGMYFSSSSKKAEAGASVEYDKALRAYKAQDYQDAILLFSSIVDNYGGTISGKLSYLYLANSYFKTSDYENALNNYKKFASKYKKNDMLLSFAMGSIGSSYEQMEKYQQAAEQYSKTVTKFPDSIQAPHYLFRAARCYSLIGNNKEAQVVYQRLIEEYPDSQEKPKAIIFKELLETS